MALPQLRPGHRLNHALLIESVLGQGGMGTVYLAHDELLDRRVAVKVLDRMADMESAALKTLLEGRAAARVVHPHVVAVHGIGDIAGVPFIEMEYVDGGSLRQKLRGTPPPRGLVATWLAQLASALTTAHETGVVHCDVKPENVMLKKRGQLAKLADFGLARSQADGRAHEPLSHGTMAYLAPELLHSPPTPASDQFALAVMAVELLAGKRPTRANPEEAPALPDDLDVPPKAMDVLQRALAQVPSQRYASAAVFVDALLRALGLAHLRGPLVGMPDIAPEETSRTSSDLPVPMLSIALHPLSVADQVMAVLAVLPSGYPGALREALGAVPPPEVLAELKRTGQIEGLADEWRWASPQPRESALRRLAPRQRRQVCARVAMAVETCGQKRESTREDATRLFLAARRLKDAARLAQESAATAKTALTRDHHLARAVALLTSQTEPKPWLAALNVRIDWLLACGWLAAARGPLAEAQGVLADATLPSDDPLRLRLNVAAARLRAATGDPQGAAQGLARILGQLPEATTPRARLELLAAYGAALRAAGDPAQAWAIIQPHVGHAETPVADDAQAALAALRLVSADALLRLERADHAALLAGQALASAEEMGDTLVAARCLLTLADAARALGQRDRQAQWLNRAAKLLQALGPTELTGAWHLRQAEALLQAKQPLAALGHVERAAACFAVLGLTRHDATVAGMRAAIGLPVGL
jgi:tetratricopeptide (TPR) repeat protein